MSRIGRALARGVVAVGATYTVHDTFTRANSSTSLGTADTGQAWTAHTGTWGITSNAAYLVTSSGESVATLDCGLSDIDFSVSYSGRTDDLGIVFRAIDASNWLLVYSNPGGGVETWQRVAGSYSQLHAAAGSAGASGTLRVVTSGTSINVYLDGSVLYSVTTSQFQTETRVGLRRGAAGGTAPTWDELIVV